MKTYFSFSKNYNPMVAMTGGSGTEIKLVSIFSLKITKLNSIGNFRKGLIRERRRRAIQTASVLLS